MSYELRSGEKLSKGIRRIARKQADRALGRLAQKPPEPDGRAVHEARKDLKKLRAALCLIRARMGAHAWRKEDRKFRDAGRVLAPLRDAQMLLKILNQLRNHYHGRVARGAFAKMRKALTARRRRIRKRMRTDRSNFETGLVAARQRIKKWPLEKLKWSDLCEGVRQTYKQGLKAFREVEIKPLPENVHQWRKRTKDLGHYLAILEPIQREELASLSTELKQLGDYLGDEHDLAMLDAAAVNAGLNASEMELFNRPIEDRRTKLRRAAIDCGRRFYVQKPGIFARRIGHYAKAWRG